MRIRIHNTVIDTRQCVKIFSQKVTQTRCPGYLHGEKYDEVLCQWEKYRKTKHRRQSLQVNYTIYQPPDCLSRKGFFRIGTYHNLYKSDQGLGST
jgi:hypothetical protein